MSMPPRPLVQLSSTDEGRLGKVISDRNIYPRDRWASTSVGGVLTPPATSLLLLAPTAQLNLQIEEASYEIGYWKFKDRSLRIAKAIRIPYHYIDENGNMVLEHILVGYEGEGGE